MTDEEKLNLIRGLLEDYRNLKIGMHEFVAGTTNIIEARDGEPAGFVWIDPPEARVE